MVARNRGVKEDEVKQRKKTVNNTSFTVIKVMQCTFDFTKIIKKKKDLMLSVSKDSRKWVFFSQNGH